jgi:class 3 adenylate cyclase
VASEEGARVDSVTRGFLFSDLRGYTSFVERHGAASAVDLLSAYRELVRDAVRRFGGAEIRTEGDSFYVVFDSVSAAVRCGLEIAAQAATASSERPEQPIDVGIGIHAGETIETSEGYVGSSVNIAARICALASPGEVLVSDTVRALTQTLLPVRFVPRGRRKLKGIDEPVAVFAVESVAASEDWGGERRRARWSSRRTLLAAVALTVVALATTGWLVLRPSPGLEPAQWTIGLDMPLTGNSASRGQPIRKGVQLAIDEANAAGNLGGAKLVLAPRDDAGDTPSGQDPVRGKANAKAFVAHAAVIAMVGPASSDVAASQIPVTNQGGSCSAALRIPLPA